MNEQISLNASYKRQMLLTFLENEFKVDVYNICTFIHRGRHDDIRKYSPERGSS